MLILLSSRILAYRMMYTGLNYMNKNYQNNIIWDIVYQNTVDAQKVKSRLNNLLIEETVKKFNFN